MQLTLEDVVRCRLKSSPYNFYNFTLPSSNTPQIKRRMLDHTGIFVPSSQHAAVVKFYEAVLAPLGYKKLYTEGPNEEVTGLSDNGKHADWWLVSTEEQIPEKPKMHHAFVAKGR
jgi:hypothetical protein